MSNIGGIAIIDHETERLQNEKFLKFSVEKIGNTIRPEIIPEPPLPEELPYKSLLEIVKNWNPDNVDIPTNFKESLQHFDYGNPIERAIAEKYRNAELPFKLFNISHFNEVSSLWTDAYLLENLPQIKHQSHIELSKSNHFMFWAYKGLRRVTNFVPPTTLVSDMTFSDWFAIAKKADIERLSNSSEHYYFMLGVDKQDNGRSFISRDLKMFSDKSPNFFITSPAANKGIQCRFGMRGVIAEAHYDAGRNMVAMLKGEKRYIINPPSACSQLGVIADTRHPSYRHSVIDWSDIEQAVSRGFDKVEAIDTIVRTGEVLYIPSYWFHYIVSLKYSIQCNSRSGSPPKQNGYDHIKRCMRFNR